MALDALGGFLRDADLTLSLSSRGACFGAHLKDGKGGHWFATDGELSEAVIAVLKRYLESEGVKSDSSPFEGNS